MIGPKRLLVGHRVRQPDVLDATDRSAVPKCQQPDQGLLVNADGPVDVYFGSKAPVGKENNWVQTIPDKGWIMILRLYGLLEPWFNKTWRRGDRTPAVTWRSRERW